MRIDLRKLAKPVSAKVLVTMDDGSTVDVEFPVGTLLDIELSDKSSYEEDDIWFGSYPRMALLKERKVKLTIESSSLVRKGNGTLMKYTIGR